MKKAFTIFLIICIGVGIYLCLKSESSKNEEEDKLKEVLSDKEVEKIKKDGNSDLAYRFMNTKGFDSDKLDDYLNYYKDNSNLELEVIIKLVNNDIDKIDDFVYDSIILDLIDEEYYLKKNTVRYMKYYKDNKELSAKEIVTNVNSNIDYEFYTNTKKADLSKDNLILVNKYNYLDKNYEPEDLVHIESPYTSWGGYMRAEALDAFMEMVDAAKSIDGIVLYAVSPYRSYNTQNNLYERYAAEDGYDKADTYSARPGSSEHQTGLAVDINSVDDSFANTVEGKWLKNNSYKYGFILRYPKGKEYITGYQFEPWHFRYVGMDAAKYIYEHDITYEEYYAYFVDKG